MTSEQLLNLTDILEPSIPTLFFSRRMCLMSWTTVGHHFTECSVTLMVRIFPSKFQRNSNANGEIGTDTRQPMLLLFVRLKTWLLHSHCLEPKDPRQMLECCDSRKQLFDGCHSDSCLVMQATVYPSFAFLLLIEGWDIICLSSLPQRVVCRQLRRNFSTWCTLRRGIRLTFKACATL